MRYTVENFKRDIEKADAVRVDGGPLLDNWTSDEEELLVANWWEDDLEYTCEIVADAIISLAKQEKKIVVKTEDNHYAVEMYRLLDVNQSIFTIVYRENGIVVPDKTKSFADINAARKFYKSLLEEEKEVENLETIANNLEDWFNYDGKEITVLITNLQ